MNRLTYYQAAILMGALGPDHRKVQTSMNDYLHYGEKLHEWAARADAMDQGADSDNG